MSNKTTSPKISIIISLYNAEKYISYTLESILNQTFQNYEVIVVDDCSVDKSFSIAKTFYSRFNGRLQLYKTKKNSGGPGKPFNTGLLFARGDYIFFMDCDDLLDKVALATIYQAAVHYCADTVYMDRGFRFSGDVKYPSQNEYTMCVWQPGPQASENELIVDNTSSLIEMFMRFEIGWPAWQKLVKREFLKNNDIVWPQGVPASADIVWTLQVLLNSKRWLKLPVPLYFYRRRENSVCSKIRSTTETIEFYNKIYIKCLRFIQTKLNNEFLRNNPRYKLSILDIIAGIHFLFLKDSVANFSQNDLYIMLENSFSDDYPDLNSLLAYLCITTASLKQS